MCQWTDRYVDLEKHDKGGNVEGYHVRSCKRNALNQENCGVVGK